MVSVQTCVYGMCHCQSYRKQWVLCTCSNGKSQAVLPSPHNNSVQEWWTSVCVCVVQVTRSDCSGSRVTVDISRVCSEWRTVLLSVFALLHRLLVTSPNSPSWPSELSSVPTSLCPLCWSHGPERQWVHTEDGVWAGPATLNSLTSPPHALVCCRH